MSRWSDDAGRGSSFGPSRSTQTSYGASTISPVISSRPTSSVWSTFSENDPFQGDGELSSRIGPAQINPTPVLSNKCYEQAFVSHVEHPSAFFIQFAHNEMKYNDIQEKINQFYSTQSKRKEQWKLGEFCVVEHRDGQYYRAKIIEVPKVTKVADCYDVVYVDYGNYEKVPVVSLHKLEAEFAMLPAQAVPCSLTKTLPISGQWFDNPEALEYFKQLVSEKFVDVTFYLKQTNSFWPLPFVDLKLSDSKIDVRQSMKEKNFILDATDEEIYRRFQPILRNIDLRIYSIDHDEDDATERRL